MGNLFAAPADCTLNEDGGVYFKIPLGVLQFSDNVKMPVFLYPKLTLDGYTGKVITVVKLAGAESWLIPGPQKSLLWRTMAGGLIKLGERNSRITRASGVETSIKGSDGIEYNYDTTNLSSMSLDKKIVAWVESTQGGITKIKTGDDVVQAFIHWNHDGQPDRLFINGRNYLFQYHDGKLTIVSQVYPDEKNVARFQYDEEGLLTQIVVHEGNLKIQHTFTWQLRRYSSYYAPMERAKFFDMKLSKIDNDAVDSYCSHVGFIYKRQKEDNSWRITIENPLTRIKVEKD